MDGQSRGRKFDIGSEAVPVQTHRVLRLRGTACNGVDQRIEIMKFEAANNAWLPNFAGERAVERGSSIHGDGDMLFPKRSQGWLKLAEVCRIQGHVYFG